ncbi:MAG: hypothetical protein J6A04_01735 [Clostridia bacterium]|nr:hypothetical protein [Clostridia bacterium]
MAKRNKSQQRSNRYSIQDYDIRPVTQKDTWCLTRTKNGEIPPGKFPFGYIVTIPYIPSQTLPLEDVDGYIVRTKKHCGTFMLQIIGKEIARHYNINSFSVQPSRMGNKKHSKNKLCRVLNIRNLDKVVNIRY